MTYKITQINQVKYSVSALPTGLPNQDELNMRVTGRSGFTLPATIGNDVDILLPFYKMLTSSGYAFVEDEGGLDIGSHDGFTLCGWCNCEDVAVSGYKALAGKYIWGSGAPDGTYGLRIDPTTKYIVAMVKSTGGQKFITHSVDAASFGWFFFRMDINQTANTFRLFVNEVQVGGDVSYTGSFSALDDIYRFSLSAGQDEAGHGYIPGQIHHSDTWVLNKILTATEASALMNNRVSDTVSTSDMLGYWACTSPEYQYDLTENGLDLLVNGNYETTHDIKYSASGSPFMLDKGFSMFKASSQDADYRCVPYNNDGEPITDPPIHVGYYFFQNIDGMSYYHNLSDSLLQMNNSQWDRSNTTIWSASARGGYYESTYPTAWHPTEINQDVLDSWLNEDYKDVVLVNLSGNSINDRNYIEELFAYGSALVNNDLLQALQYTGDYSYMFTHFTRYGAGYMMGITNNPTAVYYNEKTYISYLGTGNDPYIIVYDHSSGWGSPVKIGENPLSEDPGHTYPSLLIDSDGYIHVFWGAHYSQVVYAKSDSPEDISAWTEIVCTADGTYMQPMQFSNGTIYLFYRKGNPSSIGWYYVYRTSSDGGATWSEETTVFEEYAYMRFIKGTGDVIHVSGEGLNTASFDRRDLWYCKFEGGQWKDTNDIVLSLPITPSDDIKILDTGENAIVKSVLALDSSNNPYIAYAIGDGNALGISDFEYYFAKYDSGWEFIKVGPYCRMNNNGVPGLIIGDTIEMYLCSSKSETGLGGDIEKWISADGGDTWGYDSVAIPGNIIFPGIVFNGQAKGKITVGEYNPDYTKYEGKGYLYGNSGLVKNYKGHNI